MVALICPLVRMRSKTSWTHLCTATTTFTGEEPRAAVLLMLLGMTVVMGPTTQD
jgi:hypothetical protein